MSLAVRTVAVSCLLLTLSARSVEAEEVIVLEALVPAGFPRNVQQRLSNETRERLAGIGLTVRGGADIDVAAQAAADCPDAACLQERLGPTGARLAARLRIEEAEGGFTAKLEITTLRAGVVLVNEEADCSGCSTRAVTEVALSLIDGLEIPAEDPTPAPVEPAPVEPEPVEIVPPPTPEPPPRPERHGLSPWVWITGAAGLLSIGTSIPLLIMDGDPTCDGPSSSCPEVYDTQTAGITFLAVGAGFLVTAGVMALLGWEPSSSSEERTALRMPRFDLAWIGGSH